MTSSGRSSPRALAALATVVVLVAGACGGGDSNDAGNDAAPTTAVAGAPAAGGGQTFPISMDGHPDDFNTTLTSFFPKAVQAHPGDSLKFTSNFGGEPHTVALGRVVDEAVASGDHHKLPQVFDEEAAIVPLSAPLQAGGQPCFIVTGDPPLKEACPPAQQQPPAAFTGRQSLFSSGFLPDEATFTVKLAADIAPGTYHYICLVHELEEVGTLTVVPASTPIPSAQEVAANTRQELKQIFDTLRPEAEKVKTSTSPQATVGAKVPGLAVPHDINVFPEEISVPAGGAVTWSITNAHTVSFNAPEDARPLYQQGDNGEAIVNRKGADPAGGPGQPPVPNQPPPPTGRPLVVDGGTFDGSGFRNSGILVSLGDPVEFKLTFSKPGTYKYQCLFHLDMEGVVKVG